jgi:hypothetical protein
MAEIPLRVFLPWQKPGWKFDPLQPHIGPLPLPEGKYNAFVHFAPAYNLNLHGDEDPDQLLDNCGLLHRESVLPVENNFVFQRHTAEYVEHFQPRGPVERHLVNDIATYQWRLDRLRRMETGFLGEECRRVLRDANVFKIYRLPEGPDLYDMTTILIGRVMVRRAEMLLEIARLEAHLRKMLFQSLDYLAKLQKLRGFIAGLEPEPKLKLHRGARTPACRADTRVGSCPAGSQKKSPKEQSQ